MRDCIIGLTGFDGAGKTTVANYLAEHHGFTIMSFADELKRLLMILDPIVGVDEEGDDRGVLIAYPVRLSDFVDDSGVFHEYDLKTQYPEYRRLLRTFGTEVVRDEIDHNIWVDSLYRRLLNEADKAKEVGQMRVVVPDVRFHNEATILGDASLVLGTAHTLAFVKSATPEAPESDAHPSNLYAGLLWEDWEIKRDSNGNVLTPSEVAEVETLLDHLGVGEK